MIDFLVKVGGATGIAERIARGFDAAALDDDLATAAAEGIAVTRHGLEVSGDAQLAKELRPVRRPGGIDIVAPADAAFQREFGTIGREAEPFAATIVGAARRALRRLLRR